MTRHLCQDNVNYSESHWNTASESFGCSIEIAGNFYVFQEVLLLTVSTLFIF